MDIGKLKEILQKNESTHLDFKQKYPQNNADFIHDILCMANVMGAASRYLIYGIADNKDIIGFSVNEKKTSSNIVDLLRNAKLNSIPQFEIFDFNCGNGLIGQILEIQNSNLKPFWAISDYQDGKNVVRAGVIYTRLGDRNVALRESTPEKVLENLFRERFGIDKTASERFDIYIEDCLGWACNQEYGRVIEYYYELHPEFTVSKFGEELYEPERLYPWMLLFPSFHVMNEWYQARFKTIQLFTFSVYMCDGDLFYTTAPSLIPMIINDKEYQCYYYNELDREYPVQKMFDEVGPSCRNRTKNFSFPLFKNSREAYNSFEEDLKNGMKKYHFFQYEPEYDLWSHNHNGKKSILDYRKPADPN